MFVAKPHKFGTVQTLDGSDVSQDILDLAAADGAALLNAQDFGEFGNPDGASGALYMVPGVMDGAPQGNLRKESISGRGNLQKTAKTSAPMRNPFPAPTSSVRTTPSSIKV